MKRLKPKYAVFTSHGIQIYARRKVAERIARRERVEFRKVARYHA